MLKNEKKAISHANRGNTLSYSKSYIYIITAMKIAPVEHENENNNEESTIYYLLYYTYYTTPKSRRSFMRVPQKDERVDLRKPALCICTEDIDKSTNM